MTCDNKKKANNNIGIKNSACNCNQAKKTETDNQWGK